MAHYILHFIHLLILSFNLFLHLALSASQQRAYKKEILVFLQNAQFFPKAYIIPRCHHIMANE